MSLRGGYQIIDLKMKEFSSSLNNYYRFPELFEDVKNGNAKMIILSGLNLDGVKYRDYEILVYEVNETDTPMYYQAILRRMWNTKDYKVITKYLNIYPDDRVNITMEETIYEILPDGSLSLTSKNAVQNKVITEKINEIDVLNTKQTNRINELNNGIYESDIASKEVNISFLIGGNDFYDLRKNVTFSKIGNIVKIDFTITGEESYNLSAVEGISINNIINEISVYDNPIFGRKYEIIDVIKVNTYFSDSVSNYRGNSFSPLLLPNDMLTSTVTPFSLLASQNGATTVSWYSAFDGISSEDTIKMEILFLVYNDDVTSLVD